MLWLIRGKPGEAAAPRRIDHGANHSSTQEEVRRARRAVRLTCGRQNLENINSAPLKKAQIARELSPVRAGPAAQRNRLNLRNKPQQLPGSQEVGTAEPERVRKGGRGREGDDERPLKTRFIFQMCSGLWNSEGGEQASVQHVPKRLTKERTSPEKHGTRKTVRREISLGGEHGREKDGGSANHSGVLCKQRFRTLTGVNSHSRVMLWV